MDWPPLCNRLFGAGSDENPSGALTRCLSAGAFYLTLLLKFSLDEDTLGTYQVTASNSYLVLLSVDKEKKRRKKLLISFTEYRHGGRQYNYYLLCIMGTV